MLLLQTFWKPFYCLNHYNRLKVAGNPCRRSPFSYLHSIKSCHSIPASEHSHPWEIFDIMALLEATPVVAQVTGTSLQSNKLIQFYQNSILNAGYSGTGNRLNPESVTQPSLIIIVGCQTLSSNKQSWDSSVSPRYLEHGHHPRWCAQWTVETILKIMW